MLWQTEQGYIFHTFYFSAHFGLYHVNFTDPDRKRTAKKSASFYKDVVTSRILPYNPATTIVVPATTDDGETSDTTEEPTSTDTYTDTPTSDLPTDTTPGSANRIISSSTILIALSFIFICAKLI